MQPGPPDDMSVSLDDVAVYGNREVRCRRHEGGVKRLWVFKGSGQTQPEIQRNREWNRKCLDAMQKQNNA